MGTMPKPTNTEPWQLMMAFANGGYGYGRHGGGRYLNGNRSIGSRGGSYPAPTASSSDQQIRYEDALQDYNQDNEMYPGDNGPPPTPPLMTQKIGGGYDGTTPIGPAGSVPMMIRQAALARGIDPSIALKVAASEGGLDGKFRIGDGGSSGGPFQLHVGGVARGGNGVGGLGDEFSRKYGAITAANVKEQIDFALDKAKAGGWGPWHGYKGGAWDGISRGGGSAPVVITPKQPQQRNDPDMTTDGRVSPEAIQRGKDQLQDQAQDLEIGRRASLDGKPQQVAMNEEEQPNVDEVDPSSRLAWLV